MRRHTYRMVIGEILGAGFLLLILTMGLTSCSVFAVNRPPTEEVPTLQAILPFGDRGNMYSPKFISLGPDGLVYVVDRRGAIIVLDGAELIEIIPTQTNNPGYNQGIVFHPETGLGYLPNGHTNELYLINNREIVTTLRNAGHGLRSLDINSQTGLVYVAAGRKSLDAGPSSYITVLDDTEVITTLVTGLGPNVITADPNSSKVYIGQTVIKSSPYPYAEQYLLAVLDGTSAITASIPDYFREGPDRGTGEIHNITIDPESGAIYMLKNVHGFVYWKDDVIKYGTLVRDGLKYTGLHDIAIDPNRGLAYLSSWGDPQSHVVVLKDGEIIEAIPVDMDPRGIVYDETHDYVYVANRLGHSFSVIRETELITTIQARGNPMEVAVDEERGYLYFANPDSQNITIFGFDSEIKPPTFWDFLPFVGR